MSLSSEGKTPYTALERPVGVEHQVLFTEHRLLDKFITKTVNGVTYYGCSGAPKPVCNKLRRADVDSTPEALHQDEQRSLILSKIKLTSRYKITRQNVRCIPRTKLNPDSIKTMGQKKIETH